MPYQKKKDPTPEEVVVDSTSVEPVEEKVALEPPVVAAEPTPEPPKEEAPREKSGKVFLNDEDRRLLKRYNRHIINKLGLNSTRSVKL
jgi:hypothetical protein